MSLSSVNIERFVLASGESKTWETIRSGGQAGTPATGNRVSVELGGDVQPYVLSTGQVMAEPGIAAVALKTSKDNVTYSDVATANVVYRGQTSLQGNVDRYFRVYNGGPAPVQVVVKPLIASIQPVTLL
jgi:hypothetical protein